MAWRVSYLRVLVSRRQAVWLLERCLRGWQQQGGAQGPAPGWESPFIINHRRSWAQQPLPARGARGHFTTGWGKLPWLFLFTWCQIFPSCFKKTFLIFQIPLLDIFFFCRQGIHCSLKQCLRRLRPFVLIPKKQRNCIHAASTTSPYAAAELFLLKVRALPSPWPPGWRILQVWGQSWWYSARRRCLVTPRMQAAFTEENYSSILL